MSAKKILTILFIIAVIVVLFYFFYVKPAKDNKKEKQEKEEIKPPKVIGSKNILEDGKTVEAKTDTAVTAVGSNKIIRKVKADDIIGVLFGNENMDASMLQVILPTGQKGLVLKSAIKLYKK